MTGQKERPSRPYLLEIRGWLAALSIVWPSIVCGYEEHIIGPASKIGVICSVNLSAITENVAVPVLATGLFVSQ